MGARSAAIAAVVGAGVVGGAWAATAAWGGSSHSASPVSPATVTSCASDGALDMTIRVTNSTDQVQTYALTVYWFQGSQEWLHLPESTDAIPPGGVVTLTAGRRSNTQDWRPNLTCRVEVTGTN